MNTPIRLPDWVTDPKLTHEQRLQREVKYHLIRAAAFHNPDGSIVKLSRAMGMADNSLHSYINRGGAPMKAALALEAFIGKDIISREQVAPKLYREQQN